MRLKILVLLLVTLSIGLYFTFKQKLPTAGVIKENSLVIPVKSSPGTPLRENTSDSPTQTQGAVDCDNGPQLFTTVPSSDPDLCNLTLPLDGYKVTGYTLDYPKSWKVRIGGAEGMNLLFNEGIYSGPAQQLFIQITTTKLLLKEADKAGYGFELGDTELLVDTKESVVSKKIEQIGNNSVLDLITKLDDNTIQRFFILHSQGDYATLYVFKFYSSNNEFISAVKALVASFKTIK